MTDDKTAAEGHEAPEASGDGKDKTVPLAALEAEREKRQALETRLARLEGRVEGSGGGKSKSEAAAKPFTKAQLRAAVSEGKITQDEADVIEERQSEERAAKKAREVFQSSEFGRKVSSQLAEYVEVEPDLSRDNSRLRQKVEKEFTWLVQEMGKPDNAETELTAVRTVLGPLDALKRVKTAKKAEPESHEETGTGSGEGGSSGGPPATLKLSAKEKSYYAEQIRAGRIKDWKRVGEILQYRVPSRAA